MRSVLAWGIAAVFAFGLMFTTRAAEAPSLLSGLQVGDQTEPFDAQDITGPNKGTEFCYYCKYGRAPIVCVFARETSPAFVSLVKKLDAEMNRNTQLGCFVVVLTDDPTKTAAKLEDLAKRENIANVPLTLVQSECGPPAFKIAKEADVTVMMSRTWEVKANHAYAPGHFAESDVLGVMSDLPKILSE